MNILTRLRRRIGDASITRKSIVVFVTLLIVILGLGVNSILRLGMVKDAGATISSNWMPGVQQAGEIDDAASAYRDAESMMVIAPDADTIADMKKSLALALKRIEAGRSALGLLPTSAEEAGYITEFNSTWTAYLALSQKLVELVEQKKIPEAADLLTGDLGLSVHEGKSPRRSLFGRQGKRWRRGNTEFVGALPSNGSCHDWRCVHGDAAVPWGGRLHHIRHCPAAYAYDGRCRPYRRG